ncbi:MAG: sel1 repeat family protein [Magnetococcales bacterium]|nr:sel1 repeat family protein [Magnetococcales bacterium]
MEASRLQELATKGDIDLAKSELQKEIALAKVETIQWTAGMFAAQTALIIGALFTMMRMGQPGAQPTVYQPHTQEMHAPAPSPALPADIAAIRAAAEGGNIAAMTTMGALYHYGHEVQQDDAEASRWYLLAAAKGHAGAQFIVGMLFLVGQGVTQSNAQAKYWLRRAAAQGDVTAQHQLALLRQEPSGE